MPEITKQDALRWLDMQRDAVNTEIVYAAQTEKKQYHKHLEIINALTERVNEMTAVEYLTLKGTSLAWCATHECNCCAKSKDTYCCGVLEDGVWECLVPSCAVEIVRRWKEEQDELRH